MSAQPPADIVAGSQASQKVWGIPASVTLAQWAQESGWGTRVSGKNNYGGITAKVTGAVFPFKPGSPLEPATLCWTHENWQGKRVSCQRWFKDYPTLADYFTAHAKLLATGSAYAPARAKLPNPYNFARALTGVYATDPGYGDALCAIIHGSNLTQYDGAKA